MVSTGIVVGGGIAGIACARVLADGGVNVEVRDRGSRVGGRICTRVVDGRAIDIGAAFVTARDPAFVPVLDDWVQRGLARPWTDRLAVWRDGQIEEQTSGSVRHSATRGLRSLVEDLATGLTIVRCDVEEIAVGPTVDGTPADAVVLAMPDPQARDIIDVRLTVEDAIVEPAESLPTLTLYAGWTTRSWPAFDVLRVEGSPVLQRIVDDGRRSRDAAPVLVAYSTPELAATLLDQPERSVPALVAEVRRVLGVSADPTWAYVQRWALAEPREAHAGRFHLGEAGVGLCGDGWGASRIESAFLSGHSLGTALLERLG